MTNHDAELVRLCSLPLRSTLIPTIFEGEGVGGPVTGTVGCGPGAVLGDEVGAAVAMGDGEGKLH